MHEGFQRQHCCSNVYSIACLAIAMETDTSLYFDLVHVYICACVCACVCAGIGLYIVLFLSIMNLFRQIQLTLHHYPSNMSTCLDMWCDLCVHVHVYLHVCVCVYWLVCYNPSLVAIPGCLCIYPSVATHRQAHGSSPNSIPLSSHQQSMPLKVGVVILLIVLKKYDFSVPLKYTNPSLPHLMWMVSHLFLAARAWWGCLVLCLAIS